MSLNTLVTIECISPNPFFSAVLISKVFLPIHFLIGILKVLWAMNQTNQLREQSQH